VSRFEIAPTPLAGVLQVHRRRLRDDRGYLARVFCAEELSAAGWHLPIAQINLTQTNLPGTVRGMHYQLPPYSECKLVSCIRGEVWDVALDLRKGSPTLLRWHAVRLSSDNDTALLLPEGVAHGFQTLSADAELLYCHSRPYAAQHERGVNPLDRRIAIEWPMAVSEMSPRDRDQPMLSPDFRGVSP
jgi:dTDP-4-dehydrorhamnose 3,5-epimerase